MIRPAYLSAALLGAALIPATRGDGEPARAAPGEPVAVVVELFTSEGCSSCPAADVLLSELRGRQPVAGARVIALGFHVDYWDRLGWLDRHARPEWTARQRDYARAQGGEVYTPQMIVDGRAAFVGSARGEALAAIRAAVARPHAALQPRERDGRAVSFAVEFPAPPGEAIRVLRAAVHDPPPSRPDRGENRGAVLRHVAAVASLDEVASLPAGVTRMTLRLPADALAPGTVILLQGARSGAIHGAWAS